MRTGGAGRTGRSGHNFIWKPHIEPLLDRAEITEIAFESYEIRTRAGDWHTCCAKIFKIARSAEKMFKSAQSAEKISFDFLAP